MNTRRFNLIASTGYLLVSIWLAFILFQPFSTQKFSGINLPLSIIQTNIGSPESQSMLMYYIFSFAIVLCFALILIASIKNRVRTTFYFLIAVIPIVIIISFFDSAILQTICSIITFAMIACFLIKFPKFLPINALSSKSHLIRNMYLTFAFTSIVLFVLKEFVFHDMLFIITGYLLFVSVILFLAIAIINCLTSENLSVSSVAELISPLSLLIYYNIYRAVGYTSIPVGIITIVFLILATLTATVGIVTASGSNKSLASDNAIA